MPFLDENEKLYEQARQIAFDTPEWFFDEILNYPALPWQLKAINVVFDVQRVALGLPTMHNHMGLPRLTIRSCHGTGKTQFLALLMHIWNFVQYGKIACTAPKEAQLTKRLIPRYRSCMADAPKPYRKNINVHNKEIIVFGDKDWGANMETASDPDNLAGYHDTPQLFLVDEASARRLDPMFPVIEGALTTPGSVVVEIGNPTRIDGEFHSHHCKKAVKDLYYRMHVKYTDALGLISESWVEAMKIKYGENSPVYKIRVKGEFAAFDEYLLIPLEYIEDALDIEEESDGSIPRLRVSVDVADGGQDSTVITVARIYETFMQIIKQKQFYFNASESPIKAAKAAAEMLEGFDGHAVNGDDIVVDAIGVGAGTAGTLMQQEYNVIQYRGGSSSDDIKRWRNRRVQSYMALYEAYRDGRIRISPGAVDDEEELRAHLLSIKRRTDNERVDDLEPKERIKQAGLDSPDRADSFAMLFATQQPILAGGEAPSLMGTMESTHEF